MGEYYKIYSNDNGWFALKPEGTIEEAYCSIVNDCYSNRKKKFKYLIVEHNIELDMDSVHDIVETVDSLLEIRETLREYKKPIKNGKKKTKSYQFDNYYNL